MTLLDTHVWIWLVTGSRPIPAEVMDRIQAEGTAVMLSAVSVWEAIVLMEKGRVQPRGTPVGTARTWLAAYPLTIVPVDAEIAVLAREVTFGHEDPADRFIAATAIRKRAELATMDGLLRGLPWLATVPPSRDPTAGKSVD